MDVVGVHVVFPAQHRRAAGQALARMPAGTVAGVDARDAQQADSRAVAPPEGSQLRLGIHAAASTVGAGVGRTRLVNEGAATVAIDPGGAGVHQGLGRPLCERGKQVLGPTVAGALGRGRSQVQHAVRQACQAAERGGIVEIADQRDRPRRPQLGRPRGAGRERIDAPAPLQQLQHAQADVAAANDQQSRGHLGVRQNAAQSTAPAHSCGAAAISGTHVLPDHHPTRRPRLHDRG